MDRPVFRPLPLCFEGVQLRLVRLAEGTCLFFLTARLFLLLSGFLKRLLLLSPESVLRSPIIILPRFFPLGRIIKLLH